VLLSCAHIRVQDAFLEKHGVKLGFMSAFVKASAEALMAIPAVNGVIDGTDIIYRDYCDISIAVATPKGLVVPVLRDADKLDFAGVERVRAPAWRLPRGCVMTLGFFGDATHPCVDGWAAHNGVPDIDSRTAAPSFSSVETTSAPGTTDILVSLA